MSTSNRPEISKKNLYFIPKHRFYELKHFCLQYPDWKKELAELDGYDSMSCFEKIPGGGYSKSKIESVTDMRWELVNKIQVVEYCAKKADEYLAYYILKGVTEGLSYTVLSMQYDMPCSRDTYYDRFRRFFKILDRAREGILSF